jgi:hypothetical protein
MPRFPAKLAAVSPLASNSRITDAHSRALLLPRTLLDGIARELRDGHLGRGAVLTK